MNDHCELSQLFKNQFDKHYNELKLKKKKIEISDEIFYESNIEQYNRLANQFKQLKRTGANDSCLHKFILRMEYVESLTPPIPYDKTFDYALKEFSLEGSFNNVYSDEIKNWCSQPKDIIIDQVCEYNAYRKVLKELYNLNNPHFNVEIQESPDEINETELGIPNKKSRTRQNVSDLKLLWHEEDIECLKQLYNLLIKKDNPLIENVDYLTFERNFFGKKVNNKIFWNGSLGSLVYLLDGLYDFMEEELYSVNSKGDCSIKPFISNHFLYKCKEEYREIKTNSMYSARSRFLSDQENDSEDIKISKKIDAIIQSLKDKLYNQDQELD